MHQQGWNMRTRKGACRAREECAEWDCKAAESRISALGEDDTGGADEGAHYASKEAAADGCTVMH